MDLESSVVAGLILEEKKRMLKILIGFSVIWMRLIRSVRSSLRVSPPDGCEPAPPAALFAVTAESEADTLVKMRALFFFNVCH